MGPEPNLLQILRQSRTPVSGHDLARELGTSIRTLYRDIATLQAEGADIEGSPGVGYVLNKGFFLPPLMISFKAGMPRSYVATTSLNKQDDRSHDRAHRH
ncbi:hypothetical protein GCM10007928_38100 [Sulfitobacter porphyrae]|nr:hypothetical protein GCM10007928_38100 [Sulfitobacter porphyrae]